MSAQKTERAKSYRRRAASVIKELPEDKLPIAVDFLEYLKDREEWEATWEVLSDKKLMAGIKAAEADWAQGKKGKFVPWEKVKRSV